MTRKGQKLSTSARENGRKAEQQVLARLGIGVVPCQGGQVGPSHLKELDKQADKSKDMPTGCHAGTHGLSHGPTNSKGKEKVCPAGNNVTLQYIHANDNNSKAESHPGASEGVSIQAGEASKQLTERVNETVNTEVPTTLIANLPSSEFPALKYKGHRSQPSTGHQANGDNQMGNAWQNKKPKAFMNVGVGGKLEFSKASRDRKEPFLLKRSKAIPKERVWGYSLLGQFVGSNPGYYAINEVRKSWGVQSRFKEEGGFLFFLFDNEYDRDKVLKEGPYVARGRTLIIKHIPDKFTFNKGCMALIPIWARIHGLPKDYWTAEILGELASKLGTPLFMDPVTENGKRGTYARVLVELNFAEEITREFKIAYEDGEVSVCKVLYENEPDYCPACFSLGHAIVACTFNNRELAKVEDKKVEASHGTVDGTNSKAQDCDDHADHTTVIIDHGAQVESTERCKGHKVTAEEKGDKANDHEAQVQRTMTCGNHNDMVEEIATHGISLPTEAELNQNPDIISMSHDNVQPMQELEEGHKAAKRQADEHVIMATTDSVLGVTETEDASGLHGSMQTLDPNQACKEQPEEATKEDHAEGSQQQRKKKSKLVTSGKKIRSKSVPPDGRKETNKARNQVVISLPALIRKWPPKPSKVGINEEQQHDFHRDQD